MRCTFPQGVETPPTPQLPGCFSLLHGPSCYPLAVRIAIDTNVLIAALTRPQGRSARIVRAWLDGDVEVVASEATVREAELVLGGRWLRRAAPHGDVASVLDSLRRRTVWVESPYPIADLGMKDEGDIRIVETAVTGGASYVVTTDREFLSHRGYGGIEFVTPGEFWTFGPGG